MDYRIIWTALSRFHDWSDKAFPIRMLNYAVSVGAAGPVEWISIRERKRRRIQINDLECLAVELFDLAEPDPKNGIISLEAGGNAPSTWTISAHLPPFVARENRTWGYGVVTVLFDPARFTTFEASSALVDAFLQTHSPNDTEYACIHPFQRLQELRNTMYKQPVTFTPMLSGVFWANFLGRGQLDLFDTLRLRDVRTYRVEWIDNEGLFVIVTANLGDAAQPKTEQEMQRLTADFQRALK